MYISNDDQIVEMFCNNILEKLINYNEKILNDEKLLKLLTDILRKEKYYDLYIEKNDLLLLVNYKVVGDKLYKLWNLLCEKNEDKFVYMVNYMLNFFSDDVICKNLSLQNPISFVDENIEMIEQIVRNSMFEQESDNNKKIEILRDNFEKSFVEKYNQQFQKEHPNENIEKQKLTKISKHVTKEELGNIESTQLYFGNYYKSAPMIEMESYVLLERLDQQFSNTRSFRILPNNENFNTDYSHFGEYVFSENEDETIEIVVVKVSKIIQELENSIQNLIDISEEEMKFLSDSLEQLKKIYYNINDISICDFEYLNLLLYNCYTYVDPEQLMDSNPVEKKLKLIN